MTHNTIPFVFVTLQALNSMSEGFREQLSACSTIGIHKAANFTNPPKYLKFLLKCSSADVSFMDNGIDRGNAFAEWQLFL